MTKKVAKKVTKKKAEPKLKKLDDDTSGTLTSNILTLYDNSFGFCIHNVTGIPLDLFNNIDYIMQNVTEAGWHKPYIDVLKHHSYDMIFFSYEQAPLEISDEKKLRDYEFATLPTGKCIILGHDVENKFKCIVGLMEDYKVLPIYDPEPSRPMTMVYQLGYFISTFVTPPAVYA